MRRSKIVEWPHYHVSGNHICEKLGWEDTTTIRNPFFKDIVVVTNSFIFIIYLN
jgi:hypothetical protein